MSGIALIDYGAGNLRSVARALQRLGADFFITDDPEDVRAAKALILPGQGAFRDCVLSLAEHGLDEALLQAFDQGKPYLGICLGLQLLFDSSEEFGDTPGLGILPGKVLRFNGPAFQGAPPPCKIPHMGWSRVQRRREHPIFHGIDEGSYFYFVHSYYVSPERDSDSLAVAEHGGEFSAAAGRGRFVGVQFHPEKSQEAGLRLLGNFLRWADEAPACS